MVEKEAAVVEKAWEAETDRDSILDCSPRKSVFLELVEFAVPLVEETELLVVNLWSSLERY